MPNHAHVIFRPCAGHEPEDILQSWKGYTAHELNARLQRRGALWQQESYDTLIRDPAHLAKAVRYIGQNPAKAHLAPDNWHRWVDPEWQRLGWGFPEEADLSSVQEDASDEDDIF